MTGAFVGGTSNQHPCFADTDHNDSPSAEILQRVIEINAKYQLTNVQSSDNISSKQQSTAKGSKSLDYINQYVIDGADGAKVLMTKYNVTKTQYAHNSRFIMILAIAIAMNTTHTPTKVSTQYHMGDRNANTALHS